MTDLSTLRELLTKLLFTHHDTAPFQDDDSLFLSGRLDSMDAMEIAFFLEENYGVTVNSDNIKLEEFDSLATIRRHFIDSAL